MPDPKEEFLAKQKALAEAEARRVEGFKACAGKTYAPNNPPPNHDKQIVAVIGYEGIALINFKGTGKAIDALPAHTFLCESSNPDYRWKPACSIFLENFHEVTVEKIEKSTEVI